MLQYQVALRQKGIEGFESATGKKWDTRFNHYMENALSEIESCLRTGLFSESEALQASYHMGKRLAYELLQR